jgi:hypothetical protein
LRVMGSDGIRRWMRRTLSGLREVSAHRALRLDRAYRHRDKLERVRRHSRLDSDLKLGQPVFHGTLGYGTVAAIEGDNVIFASENDKSVTHTVKALELLTRVQAEVGLETCYFEGGAKAWRRAAGRWASLCKHLCLMEGKGRYEAWLKFHGLNRSSMDDLIRRFEDETKLEAEERILPESGKTAASNPAPEIGLSPYVVTGSSQVNERTPDRENDSRQKHRQIETSKREGIKPTHHRTILYLQRRDLDPERLALYYAAREGDRERVDAIMQTKIDEGIEEVLALVPLTRRERR